MRRLLLFVGAIVLVDIAFFAAIAPLLPFYADRFELGKTGAGILAGAYAAGTLLAALPSGWLTVRIGARKTVLIGLALLSVSSLGFAFADSVAVLDATRFLQGVGGAFSWAGGLGWLLSATPSEQRGATIGKALSFALAGLLAAPALGALAREIGPEGPFTAIAVLGALLFAVALRMPAPPAALVRERPLAAALRQPRVRAGMFLVTVLALVFGAIDVLVPLELDRLGATSAGIAATFLVAAAIEGVAQPLMGRATDRVGRTLPLRAGFAGTVAFMAVLPLPDTAVLFAVVMVVGSVVAGATNTPSMALLSDGIDEAGVDQGFGFALVNLTWAGGQVIGAVAGGALAEVTSDAVVYLSLAIACAATLAGLVRRARRPAVVGRRP
jgi:MFS family permease